MYAHSHQLQVINGVNVDHASDSGSTNMSISMMTSISEQDESVSLDDDCPDYDAVVNKSANAHYLSDPRSSLPLSRGFKGITMSSERHGHERHQSLPVDDSRRNPRPLPQTRRERYIYTYRLVANGAPLHFLISVESETGRPRPGKYTFRLSLKTNGIERSLCEPTSRILRVDPRQLYFVVFMFPGKSGVLPAGCLWSLRVWLRVNGVDHRLFGEDDLWVAKDPDFNAMGNASFARLRNTDGGEHVYHGIVGKALVTFTVRWESISNKLYKYSLMYEASGVGDILFEDFRLRLDGDPRAVKFVIFTTPNVSMPAGASHKLRVWIQSLVPLNSADTSTSYVLPFNDSYIYQRIWKCDSFKIGGRLEFETLGSKMTMGFSSGMPETVVMPHPPPLDLYSSTPFLHEKKEEF